MKTVIILSAGQFERGISRFLNTEYIGLVRSRDNSPSLYYLNRTEKQERESPADVPILPVDQAAHLEPDYIIAGVTDPTQSEQLKSQATHSGFHGEFIPLRDPYEQFDIGSATLRQLAKRLHCQKVPGYIAELGVYKRGTAWKLNALFPGKRLYLFDTFEGFDPRDIGKEEALECSQAREGELSDTSETAVLNRPPFPQDAVIHKGHFPGTAQGLEDENYALVGLNASLYAPLLSGLEYFYPHLSPEDMILLHNYNSERFQGTRRAVEDYEKCHHPLVLIPLCDLHGSAVIVRP